MESKGEWKGQKIRKIKAVLQYGLLEKRK